MARWPNQMTPNRSEIECGVFVTKRPGHIQQDSPPAESAEVVLARRLGEDEVMPKISFVPAEGAGDVMYRSSLTQQARWGGVRVFDQGQHEM